MKTSRNCHGITFVEIMVATAVTALVLAGAAVGIITLQRSFVASKHYSAAMNDGSRLVDYVTRDLRNALKVSRRESGVETPFKQYRESGGTWIRPAPLEVTENNHLVIYLPDYFVSNEPDNTSGSSYKLPRFSRANLPTGKTHFSYNDVVTTVGSTRVPRYPGYLEVRYLRKARSEQDPTPTYFRQEYEGGTLRQEQEIAENFANGRLIVQWANHDQRFRVLTSFASRWQGEATRNGTQQFTSVQLLNKRRD